MKDWCRVYDDNDTTLDVESGEWNKIHSATQRLIDTGVDEILTLRLVEGGIAELRASNLSSVLYLTEETFRSAYRFMRRIDQIRYEVDREFPELES